ncbi:MAG: sensor domain-containing diguanylate cyclase [Candidatus Omnitrophota bacterium]
MEKTSHNLSISSRGLKPKLYVAVSLMSIIPILICLNFIFPNSWLAAINLKLNVGLIVLITLILASAGYRTIKEMIDPVIKMSSEAKRIAGGELGVEIDLKREDEIGELGFSLNQLTHRIRENMEELKDYSERTREINLEINKRVLVLSGMLQISNLISQNAAFGQVVETAVEKAMQIEECALGALFLREENSDDFVLKSGHGSRAVELANKGMNRLTIKPQEGALGRIVGGGRLLTVNSAGALAPEAEELQKLFSLTNLLIAPISTRDKVIGIFIVGNNRKGFGYPNGDAELMTIFAKQIAIAWENDFLAKNVAKLQVKDDLTGLYNESYIRTRLDEEIRRAIKFQRPCAFILLEVDGFKRYLESFGVIAAESALKRIALVLVDSVTDIDKAARFSDNQFALILPEKNKRQCLDKAEEIRKKIEFLSSEEKDENRRLTATGAVTENPIDGVTAEDLISKAVELIKKAKGESVSNKVIA